MQGIELKRVIQLGIVVADADTTARHYREVFGIAEESMMVLDTRELDDWRDQQYRGNPVRFDLKVVLFNHRGIQFELIEPLGGEDNCYSEFLRDKGPGIQHIFIHMEDFDKTSEALIADGVPILTSGHMLGADYRYFDFSDKLGLILETAKLPEDYVQSIIDS